MRLVCLWKCDLRWKRSICQPPGIQVSLTERFNYTRQSQVILTKQKHAKHILPSHGFLNELRESPCQTKDFPNQGRLWGAAALGLAMNSKHPGCPACPEGTFPIELRSWRVLFTLLLAATLENSPAFPLKIKHRLITWPSNSPSRHITKRNEKYVHTETWIQVFMEAFFIIAQGGNNPNVHQLVNGETKCGPSVQ